MLHVKPSNSNKVMFQAFIRDIEENKILIYGLHFGFNTYYNETAKFDIRYFQSRIPPERMHRAVNAIKDRGQESKIFPVGRKTTVKVKKITSFFNNKVETNPEQRSAVENILSETSGSAPFMVHGPPGTGKTVTIVEAILQLVKSNSNNRILVCTDSNMAADHVASVLIQYKSELPMEKFILRASSQFRVWETLPECLKPYSNGTNRKNYESVSLKDFKTYNIVVTTLLHAAKYGNEAKKKFKKSPVSHLFIDEAAQASEPACLVPVAGLLAKNGRLVLSGDHQQLGPVVISRGAAIRGLGLSLMERLKRDCNLYSDSRNDPNYIVMLRKNFRSNPDILDIPNKLFYNGQLVNLFEENTFKQYYYQTLSDEESSNTDNLSIVKDSPKQKRKRDEEESLDKFFEFSKNKNKKQCSSVSRAQPNGGVAYLSTNREDACSSTHLIKIEVYELKTLAKIPSSEHWKNATIRIKYYTDDKTNILKASKRLHTISQKKFP
ncbi:hypothetical protein K1T71_015311 [Dendrolimus kikuchii]|nr:hypothetical protein K1T71_015311 [Dendrolimus kikuchii]